MFRNFWLDAVDKPPAGAAFHRLDGSRRTTAVHDMVVAIAPD
jgi:hypothetical protein